MSCRTSWAHDNLTLHQGYHFRNRLTVLRVESAGYALTPHAATFRLRALDGLADLITQGMNLVATPDLATIDGVPFTLVAQFDLVLVPTQLVVLTVGQRYRYVVDFYDSRNQVTPAEAGIVYYQRLI